MPDYRDRERPGPVPGTVASFFSGAGGGTLGLVRAGWTPVSFSEIDPFPRSILETHWPDVPQLGDIAAVEPHDIPDATLWMGGFPCQDLSLAGSRAGLAGARSGLAFTFLELVRLRRPRAVLLENVRGLLSSNQGRDFRELQDQVGNLGYSVAWRLLDAQYASLPQRRQRVFILALNLEHYPDGQLPGAVLGIRSSCPRDHVAERDAWQAVARRPRQHPVAGGSWDAPALLGSAEAPGRGSGTAIRLPRWVDDPPKLDAPRFKAIGNGVVATQTQWIGHRLLRALQEGPNA